MRVHAEGAADIRSLVTGRRNRDRSGPLPRRFAEGATGSALAAAAKAARDVLVGRLPGAVADQFVEDRFQEFRLSIFSTPVAITRNYQRFSDAAEDVENVRIYQGIHFRFADAVARRQGKRAADWAEAHFLRPQ